MQKIGKITSGTYEVEIGRSLTVNADGALIIRESWVMNNEDRGNLIPPLRSSNEDEPTAQLYQIQITGIGSDLIRVLLEWKTYVAVSGGGVSINSNEEFTLQSINFENDIGAHPRRELIKTKADSNAGGTGLGWLIDSDGKFTGISDKAKELADVRSYKSGTLSWSRRWSSNTKLSNNYIRDLFRVSKPDGNPPELDSPRNWLLDSISSTTLGDGYQHTATWVASESGASWAPEIYSRT
jgi:hypothetical protein